MLRMRGSRRFRRARWAGVVAGVGGLVWGVASRDVGVVAVAIMVLWGMADIHRLMAQLMRRGWGVPE